AATGSAALESAARTHPDAVILDLGLPDLDGLDIIHGLRGWSAVPIIVLSGDGDPRRKIRALDAGADDYVVKPFSMDELLARLRAALRRPSTATATATAEEAPARAVIGDHVVDLAACTVRPLAGTPEGPAGARPVRLTPTEWAILGLLLRHPGRLVTGRRILHEVWGPDSEDKGNYLRVYFSTLRHKLERDPARPRHLVTEPGLGYRYQP
ncbi:winged helix-turn-helix domain-containing protein, partial [Streptacidiphilus griseoplanus]|uniref:winged helix-turn-helix domain-containing protein n=1 Tax=Peterkaempfera griseoplana TaxID=66896 RepID=UPI0006E19690